MQYAPILSDNRACKPIFVFFGGVALRFKMSPSCFHFVCKYMLIIVQLLERSGGCNVAYVVGNFKKIFLVTETMMRKIKKKYKIYFCPLLVFQNDPFLLENIEVVQRFRGRNTRTMHTIRCPKHM